MGFDWFSFAKWYFCTDLYIVKPACCYMPDDKSSMVNLFQCIMKCGYELCLWDRHLKLTVTLSIQESTAYHMILGVSLENLVLDQQKIPKLICFLILVTLLFDIVWYCKEKFFLGCPWELIRGLMASATKTLVYDICLYCRLWIGWHWLLTDWE